MEVDDISVKQVSNGNHGIMEGGLEENQPVHPRAWRFDGVNDVTRFGPINAVGTHPFIMMGWIKTSATDGTILARRKYTTSWYRISIASNGAIGIELCYDYNDTTGNRHYESFNSDVSINNNKWHFFALVRDNNSNVYLSVDLIEQTTVIIFPENLDSFDEDVDFTIGAWGTVSTYDPFDGYIAPIKVHVFDGVNDPIQIPNGYEFSIIQDYYKETKDKYLND